ncbi:MAG: methylmalonyl-CoA mutase [bacterium]|nr:methylmalonyl-CoA mutase [bacterium]
MSSKDQESAAIKQAKEKWENERVAKDIQKVPEAHKEFTTPSGISIQRLYTPADGSTDYLRDLGFPGEYPYTRGVQSTGYRAQTWTRRPITGFQSPEDTNKRFKYLIEHGQSGLHFVFDMPTLTGYDSDHPWAEGEVGLGGMAMDSLADFEALLEGINLDEISVSYSHFGNVMLAMLLAVAEKQGVPFSKIRGTTQNDVLMYFHSCHVFDLPLKASMKHFVDVVEFATENMPLWYTVSISGYNCREGGCSAVQEMAFAFGDAIAYIDACLERGLKIDDFVQRFSFMLDAHIDFFEEICKFRAMRRMWAKIVRERYASSRSRSCQLRFHTQTAGSSLTVQQPLNNIARSTIEAVAAVLGGTQSLHVSCHDEGFSIPSQEAAQVSLNIQNIIAYETGVTNTVDPLGGSYYVESLTDEMENAAWKILDQIDAQGGMVKAALSGWVQQEKANFTRQYQDSIEKKERIVVGVNEFQSDKSSPIEIFKVPPEFEKEKIAKLKKLRSERDNEAVKAALENLATACKQGENTILPTIEAAKTYATLGEIYQTMREIYGEVTVKEMNTSCVKV